KKRMGRSNSVTTAASSPRTEEEGSQREGGTEGNSAGREFGTKERSGGVESSNSSFEQVLRERRGRKGKKERKEESNALEESIRRALQSRRTYDGASGPFNYSIQTYNSVVTKEQERLRNDFTQGIYSFASASAADPVSVDPSSKAAASRECLSNTLDLGRMNQGMPSLKERLAAAQRASDRRRIEWRHPRPSSPSAYRRADHIHTVPLSNARLEELSGAMPWEPAMNDFLLLQSQRVPKCRGGAPGDPQGFGPKSTSKRFIRQFGPPSIYKSVHYSCDVLAAEAAERAKGEEEASSRKNKIKVTWEDGPAGKGDMRKERWITKGAIMLGRMKEAGRESLDAKLGYGVREGPPVKVGIDFARRRVPKALGDKYGEKVGWMGGQLGKLDRGCGGAGGAVDVYREADVGREFEARMRGNHPAASFNVQSGCYVPRLEANDVRGELNRMGLLIGEPAEPAPWRHTAVGGRSGEKYVEERDFDLWRQRGRGERVA
ncbi:hypothetical protein FOZ63_009251, partial [Perkinsus olseni]